MVAAQRITTRNRSRRGAPRSRSPEPTPPPEFEVESEEEFEDEPDIAPAPPKPSIKKSGATAPLFKDTKKKRSRDEPELPAAPATNNKKVKLAEDTNSASSTPRSRPTSTPTPTSTKTSTKNNISSQKSDNPRVQFRNSIYTVLESVATSDNFGHSLQKEVNKSPGALEVAKARGIIIHDTKRSNKDTSKMDVSDPSTSSNSRTSSEELVPRDELTVISQEIEEAWHAKYGRGNSSDMDAKLRELRFALRKNPSLVARLILRTLSATAMSKMNEEEMASDEARAALTQMRADDEVLRNKAAENEDIKEAEKEMSKLRGKIEDRIVGALPTFVPTAKDDDDEALEKLSSSGMIDAHAYADAKSDDQGNSSDSVSSPSTHEPTSIIPIVHQKHLKASAKVDLDLGAIDSDLVASFLERNAAQEKDDSEPAAEPTLRRVPSFDSNKSQSEILSVLDRIRYDEDDHGDNEGYDPLSTHDDHDNSSAPSGFDYRPEASNHRSAGGSSENYSSNNVQAPRSFRILDPEDVEAEAASARKMVKDIWRGKLTFPDQISDISVSADFVGGASIGKVFPRLGISSIDIGRVIETEKMVTYLSQLATSSSRAKVVLAFNPPAGDSEALANYDKLYRYLSEGGLMGVVSITGAIANEKLIKEVYVLPLPGGEMPDSNFIPTLASTPTSNRIYLCLVVDKKTLERLNTGPSPSTHTPSPLSTNLGGGALGGGVLGGSQLGGGALGPGRFGDEKVSTPPIHRSTSPQPTAAFGGYAHPQPQYGGVTSLGGSYHAPSAQPYPQASYGQPPQSSAPYGQHPQSYHQNGSQQGYGAPTSSYAPSGGLGGSYPPQQHYSPYPPHVAHQTHQSYQPYAQQQSYAQQQPSSYGLSNYGAYAPPSTSNAGGYPPSHQPYAHHQASYQGGHAPQQGNWQGSNQQGYSNQQQYAAPTPQGYPPSHNAHQQHSQYAPSSYNPQSGGHGQGYTP